MCPRTGAGFTRASTAATPSTSQNHPAMKDEGGFGGGQIGYNWQGALLSPNVVLGVEADFQGADIDHSTGIAFNNGDAGVHRRAIDEFGTVRGRLGYALGPTLVYFTGGFAYGNKTNEFTDTGPHKHRLQGRRLEGRLRAGRRRRVQVRIRPGR